MKIGIITSGGDSPGMNKLINSLRVLFNKNKIEYLLIKNGFKGIINEKFFDEKNLLKSDFYQHYNNYGGTYIGTSRLPKLKELSTQKNIKKILDKNKISHLIVIGGDGSMKGGYSLSKLGINVINIPGTIDNNIGCSEMSLGFYSALDSNIQSINQIVRCSMSHNRFFIIQVMGGYDSQLAIDTAIATDADIVLTHEKKWSIKNIGKQIKFVMNRKNSGFLVMPDLMVNNLEKFSNNLSKISNSEIRVEVLGRIQRGANPTGYDKILAAKIAVEVSKNISLNKSFAVVLQNNKITSVDIKESTKTSKLKALKKLEIFEKLKREPK